jgi:HEPN domain-containing protein
MNGAESWLHFAGEDLRVAELAMVDGLYNQVCFHAQQCVEKSLKGWLAHRGENVPRTHRMADLLNLLPNDLIGGLEDRLYSLDQFYIPTRYPDAIPGSLPSDLPGEQDAREALESAVIMLRSIQQAIAGHA